MEEWEVTVGAGSGAAGARDALCGWMGKEDLLAFEVHQVPSLGPFSLQVLQLTPELLWGKRWFWASVFEEEKVGYQLCRGLSLPRRVLWGWCFAGEASPSGVGPLIFQDRAKWRSLTAIFLKDECTQPSSWEVHLHHCTKLPGTSSFFFHFYSYIKVTCWNCHLNSLLLSVLTPSIFWGLNLLLLLKESHAGQRAAFFSSYRWCSNRDSSHTVCRGVWAAWIDLLWIAAVEHIICLQVEIRRRGGCIKSICKFSEPKSAQYSLAQQQSCAVALQICCSVLYLPLGLSIQFGRLF